MPSLPRHPEAFWRLRRLEPLLVRALDPGVPGAHAQRLHESPQLPFRSERLGFDAAVRAVPHRAGELELGGPAQHERAEADALDAAADHDANSPHGFRMDSADGRRKRDDSAGDARGGPDETRPEGTRPSGGPNG